MGAPFPHPLLWRRDAYISALYRQTEVPPSLESLSCKTPFSDFHFMNMAHENAIFQNCYYVGNILIAILYGIELALYFISAWIIWNNKNERNKRSYRLFLFLSTGMLFMITLYVSVQAFFAQKMWIIHADYPGGSIAYQRDHASEWYQTVGSVSSVIVNLLSDGFLLYRCHTAWGDRRILIGPSILYFTAFVLGICMTVVAGLPDSNFFLGNSRQFALAYSATAISLNVILSSLICGRLLYHAHKFEHVLGSEVAQKYKGAVALIVEAALPYNLFGLAYIIVFSINHPTTILFLSIYVMLSCVSPQLIMVRIVMGRSFDGSITYQDFSHVNFTGSLPKDNDTESKIAPRRCSRNSCVSGRTAVEAV